LTSNRLSVLITTMKRQSQNTTQCPYCRTPISASEIAMMLGKTAAGKPKHFSEAEKKKRSNRMAVAREKRWPKKEDGNN